MLKTPIKRPVPDIELIEDGPSSSKRSRVAAPTSSPAPSDSSPNGARPKRGHKPSKRLGTPEPLTTLTPTSRPRPRPIAKNGVLRTSLPNTPSCAKQSTSQSQDASSQKTVTDPKSRPSIVTPVQHPLVPSMPSSSRVHSTPKKPKKSLHAPSKTPSPKKKQAPLTIFLPSRLGSALSPPLGSALEAVIANEAPTVPIAGPSKSKSPRKRKAQEMGKSSPPSSSKKPRKRKKLQRTISETVIELLDSDEVLDSDEESNQPSSKPNTPRHLSPDVIDLCSEEESEPCGIATAAPISRNTTQPRTTVVASASTRQSPRSRSQTPDENPLLEPPNLTQAPSPASQHIEIADFGFLQSDEKEPTIYATSPSRNPVSDDKEFSFYSSYPSPHVESDEKDPVIVIPPSSPRYRSDSPKPSPSVGVGATLEDPADDISDFYVPSPNPDDGRANSIIELMQAQQDYIPEKTPLFLPSESDGSQEDSDTLPTDSQATQIDISQEAMPESILDSVAIQDSEMDALYANPMDPSSSLEEKPSSTTIVEEQDLPLDYSVTSDEVEQHRLSEPSTYSLADVEGGEAEEEWQTVASLSGDRRMATPDNDVQVDQVISPKLLHLFSESSEVVEENNAFLEANAVAQNPTNVGGEMTVAEPEDLPRKQELSQPKAISTARLRMRNIPAIKTNVKHAASNGPGTPSVYDPMSMPPLLTPRFFAQSCLAPRQSFAPTQVQDFPSQTVIPSETLLLPTPEDEPTQHDEPYEEPEVPECTPPLTEQEQPSVADQQVVTPATQTHEDDSLNELSSKEEGELSREEEELQVSKEDGEISDYSASPSSPPPRIDLAKMIQSSPRNARDRRLSWKEGCRFGPYSSWTERNRMDGVLMKLKSILEVSQVRPAEPLGNSEEQAGPTSETNADGSPTTEDPSTPATLETPAQEASVPLVEVTLAGTPGDSEKPQVTEGDEAGSKKSHEEESAPINGTSTTGTPLPEDQPGPEDLAVDIQPASESAPPTPTPNPITPVLEEANTSLLTVPSPELMTEEPSTSLADASPPMHSFNNEQVIEMDSVEVLLTEEMIANKPYYLEIIEESDGLLKAVLGKATFEDDSTTETDPATNSTENSIASFRTTQHRDSTSSLDSPSPVTPPTIPSRELFFVRPEDTVGFEPNNVPYIEPIEMPEFSDKMVDDMDEDEFLATHDFVYPE